MTEVVLPGGVPLEETKDIKVSHEIGLGIGVNSLKYDLSYLSIPLPEDVSKLKYFGDFKGANALIDFLLERKSTPISLENVLKLKKMY